MKKVFAFLAVGLLVFCGRTEKNIPLPAGTSETEAEGQAREELNLTPEQVLKWGVETGEVVELSVSSQRTIPGVVSLNQNRTAQISSLIEGKVTSVHSDLGDFVRKGQALLTLNSPDFARAQSDFLQARARLNLSRREYERAKLLFEDKALEQKEFLRREAEFENAATEYGVLESKLHSLGLDHDQIQELIRKCRWTDDENTLCEQADPHLNILTPLSGRIIARDVILGEHVRPEKVLFTVSNMTTLWVLLDAYEEDLPHLVPGSKAAVLSPVYPDRAFQGKILYVSDIVDEKLRTIEVRVEVKNDDSLLKPNMYVQGIIERTGPEGPALAVPDEAVQMIEGREVVFVLGEEGVYAVREVMTGGRVGPRRVVIQGLEKGEKVVFRGAFNLKAELLKGEFGHGHVH